jgi:hypothetical protein
MPTSATPSSGAGGTTCCTPRTTRRGSKPTSRRCSPPPTAFPPKGQADWQADARAAAEHGKGHGRRERRALTTSTWLNDYLTDWPRVRQVFRLVRQRTAGGKTTEEVVYGITSLGREEADAARLLALSRAPWGIENGLHYTRDETLGEDRCRVRRGEAARVLASLRNVAVSLLRQGGHPSVAAATREMVAYPERALALLKAAPSTSE